jgi:RND family efflux transporter MFP subunit
MKRLAYLLSLTVFLSCQSGDQPVDPNDIEGKRTLLAEKKKAYKALRGEIDVLTRELNRLDPPKEKAAEQVRTKILASKEFKRYIEVQGRVVADDMVNASSAVGGRLTQVLVSEGEYVKRGQLIATTDMETTEKQIAELQTSLELATTVFERQERLWKKDIGSEIQYLEAKSNKERLENSLQTIKSQTSKKNIYAPISGTVEKKYLSQGETAGPGMPIVQILNTGKTKVVADLQESLLSSIKKGDKVSIYYPALDKTVDSRVTMIGRTIDPANRTFKVELSASNMGGLLKPNLLAQVKFNDLTKSNAVIIPLDVLQEDVAGNKFAYRAITKDGKKIAEKVLLELGESNEEGVTVLIGLKAGDELVVEGAKKLADGKKITIVAE